MNTIGGALVTGLGVGVVGITAPLWGPVAAVGGIVGGITAVVSGGYTAYQAVHTIIEINADIDNKRYSEIVLALLGLGVAVYICMKLPEIHGKCSQASYYALGHLVERE